MPLFSHCPNGGGGMGRPARVGLSLAMVSSPYLRLKSGSFSNIISLFCFGLEISFDSTFPPPSPYEVPLEEGDADLSGEK